MSRLLDDAALYTRLDPSGMDAHIAGLPKQCANAWEEALALKLPARYRRAERLVVAGMGGSAIGGELASDFFRTSDGPRIAVHRDYGLPPGVNRKTLVIASSYSGNTEECLSAFKASQAKGAMLAAVTRGGTLKKLAVQKGIPVFPIAYDSQPRAAIGYSLMPVLAMAQSCGLSKSLAGQVREAVGVLENLAKELHPATPTEENRAKQVAEGIGEKTVIIVGAEHLTGTARRWKAQIQENAKSWAYHDALPEFDHNSVEGLAFPIDAASRSIVIFLSSGRYREQTKRRIKATIELLQKSGVATEVVEASGKGPLANILMSVLFGDYVSYYLAMLRGVDPTPVPNLSWIKERLAQR